MFQSFHLKKYFDLFLDLKFFYLRLFKLFFLETIDSIAEFCSSFKSPLYVQPAERPVVPIHTVQADLHRE